MRPFALLPLFVTVALCNKKSWNIYGSQEDGCEKLLETVPKLDYGGSCQPLEGFKSFAFLGNIKLRVSTELKLWSDDKCTKQIDYSGDGCIGEDVTKNGRVYFTVEEGMAWGLP